MTLTEFMAAQLDEDEAKAEDLIKQLTALRGTLQSPKSLGRITPGWHSPTEAIAMCTQALADIAAKRAIIDCHEPRHHPDQGQGFPAWDECMGCGGDGKGDWPCETVLIVASVYRGRPGWQTAWEVKA